MKALIVGGGIGGLASALALGRAGFEIAIREAAPELLPIGAGLLLQPNARAALVALGLDEAVRAAGVAVERGRMCSAHGKTVQDMDLLFGGKRPAAIGIHRGTLQRLLIDALGPAELELGRRATGLSERGTVLFADGTEEGADVVVGADGVDSVLASSLHALRRRYGGYTCWRGVTAEGSSEELCEGGVARAGSVCEIVGKGRRFGIVPIDAHRVYWFATLNTPEGGRDEPGDVMSRLASIFEGFPDPVGRVLGATEKGFVLRDDIADRIPLAAWGRDNVTLLGDAAHPMTPNLGQGACQAIIDAVELGRQLSRERCRSSEDVPAALRAYEKERIPRTKKIVEASWNMGRMGQLENPVLRWMRDRVLSSMPTSYTERQVTALLG